MKGTSWTCHICGRERPDDKISVVSKPIVFEGRCIGEQNIRYCNDNEECMRKAPDFSHFHLDEPGIPIPEPRLRNQ